MAQPFVVGCLLVLVHLSLLTLGKESCTTCEITAGLARGAIDFGSAGNTSLILSRPTSQAIRHSSTPLSFTIEGWVGVGVSSVPRQPQPLFARYPRTAPIQGDSYAEFVLQIQANNNLNLFFGGGSENINRVGLDLDCGFGLLPESQWTHLALAVTTPGAQTNPSEVAVYINGLLACQWSAAKSPFVGTRQVMHDQPFALSNYEDYADCDGTLQTFQGIMDEVRVWAGARSAEQILASYATVVPSTAPGLVAQFHFDEETQFAPGTGFAVDSSPTAADAWFTGLSGETPQWTTSGAPIVSTVQTANFMLTPITFYGYSANLNDGWFVVVNTSNFDPETDFLYQDSYGQVLLSDGGSVLAAPGALYPVAYYESLSQTDSSVALAYTASSNYGLALVSFNTAQISIEVTANGCDGAGGKLDRCGVCNGNGKCAPFGCDGLGNSVDECGVCNGNGTTCECALTSWRNYTATGLDESILYSDLALLSKAMGNTEEELTQVTKLLLAGDDALTCAKYGEVLLQVQTFTTQTQAYNTDVLTFLNSLN